MKTFPLRFRILFAAGATIALANSALAAVETLFAFSYEGSGPRGELIQAADGKLIGATNAGGKNRNVFSFSAGVGAGTIFAIDPTTGEHSMLHHFEIETGYYPQSGPMLASDGNYYGTTSSGGAPFSANDGQGTVYRLTPAGVHTMLYHFKTVDGSPHADLVEGADGALYGTTPGGGANSKGTVFKVTKDGTYTLLHSFTEAEGQQPFAGLCRVGDDFYSVAYGYPSSNGCVYKIAPNGDFEMLHAFNGSDGKWPQAKLVKGTDGLLYGVTQSRGSGFDPGTAFKISTTGTFTSLHSFTSGQPTTRLFEVSAGVFMGSAGSVVYQLDSNGAYQELSSAGVVGALMRASDTKLYGFGAGTGSSGGVVSVTTAGAISLVHSFGQNDGETPNGGLFEDPTGDFFLGVTKAGGKFGKGVAYQVTPMGDFEVVHNFNGSQGDGPIGELIQSGGNYYGVTNEGGTAGEGDNGTVYQLAPTMSGMTHTVLHDFAWSDGNFFEGASPEAGLIDGQDGFLYGTTRVGISPEPHNVGTIFKITTGGAYTFLHSPRRGEQRPSNFNSPFIADPMGGFFSTSDGGGARLYGTLFHTSTAGDVTRLHDFDELYAKSPIGGVARDANGNLYGVTDAGGDNGGGVIYKYGTDGQFTILHHFTEGAGARPQGGVILGADGALYGVAGGGSYQMGCIYKCTTTGEYSLLHSFKGTDGSSPGHRLLLGSDNKFYGVTRAGGPDGAGTVYRFDPTPSGNAAPIARDDLVLMPAKTGPITFNPLANDEDPNNDSLTVIGINQTTNSSFGTVAISPDGKTITYTPNPPSTFSGFFGYDDFLYMISDGQGGQAAAEVRIKQLLLYAGEYTELLLDPATGEPVGLLYIKLTKTGGLTGKVTLLGATTGFGGKLDATGRTTPPIEIKPKPKGTPSYFLQLNLSTGGVNLLEGKLTAAGKEYEFRTFQATRFSSSVQANIGTYNVLLSPAATTPGDPALPQGTGWGTFVVSKTGSVKIVARTGDNGKFTVGTGIRADGRVPIFADLYKKPKGRLVGQVTFPPSGGPSFNTRATGTLAWTKPQQEKQPDPFYPAGFTTTTDFDASFYFAPTKIVEGKPDPAQNPTLSVNARVFDELDDSNGDATFTLSKDGVNPLVSAFDLNITTKHKATLPLPAGLKSFTLTPKSGRFKAVVINPDPNGKPITINGVIHQEQGRGAGLFLNDGISGNAEFEAKP